MLPNLLLSVPRLLALVQAPGPAPAPAAVPLPPAVVSPPPVPRGLLQYFQSTGFIGPLLVLLAVVAAVVVVRRLLALRLAALAPEGLQRLLEPSVRGGQFDQARLHASASRTALGDLVAAGLLLRGQGLDDMLANCERAAIKASLQHEARSALVARLGTSTLLLALLGTVLGLMNTLAVLAAWKNPTPGAFCEGLCEALASTALGLFFALLCYWVHGGLAARAVTRLLAVREIAEELLVEAARKP